MTSEAYISPLTDQVQRIRADDVELPVLRELVREVQSRSSNELADRYRGWSDTTWRQYADHASHNPW